MYNLRSKGFPDEFITIYETINLLNKGVADNGCNNASDCIGAELFFIWQPILS